LIRRAKEHTHALFALKVQRKGSNVVAGLATVGSSLDREKSRQWQPSQQCNLPMNVWAGLSIKNPDRTCVSRMPQFERE
jgi:hypothetical protein